MTAPTEPGPGAPAGTEPTTTTTPPAGTEPSATTPPATPPAPQQLTPPWERDGQPFDPDRAWKLIEQLRTDNTKLKTDRQQDAQAASTLTAEMKKLLGITTDPADPAALTQQIEQAQDAAYAAAVELAVYKVDPQNAAVLLDSMSFLRSLDDIEHELGTSEFAAALAAKVQDAAAARTPNGQAPTVTAPGQAPGPRPDPSQGTRGTPTAVRPTSLGEAIGRHYTGKR